MGRQNILFNNQKNIKQILKDSYVLGGIRLRSIHKQVKFYELSERC